MFDKMCEFFLYLLGTVLPEFLMAEPICYFVGAMFGFCVIAYLRALFHVAR